MTQVPPDSPCSIDPVLRQLMIIRESRGLKQSYIAHKIRSTQTAISEAERGAVDPKISRIRSYAQALNLSLYLGNQEYFPDLEKMSLEELVDLYHLLGDEMQKRLECSMTREAERIL